MGKDGTVVQCKFDPKRETTMPSSTTSMPHPGQEDRPILGDLRERTLPTSADAIQVRPLLPQLGDGGAHPFFSREVGNVSQPPLGPGGQHNSSVVCCWFVEQRRAVLVYLWQHSAERQFYGSEPLGGLCDTGVTLHRVWHWDGVSGSRAIVSCCAGEISVWHATVFHTSAMHTLPVCTHLLFLIPVAVLCASSTWEEFATILDGWSKVLFPTQHKIGHSEHHIKT